MVSGKVIAVMLTLVAVMGVVPIIGASVLLVMKKIKGSAFWMGVLTAIVSSIVMSVVQVIAFSADSGPSAFLTVTVQVIAAVVDAALILLCFKVFIRKSADFKGAVSLGLGFGAVNLITYAFSLLSNYMVALMINKGTFDMTYAASIEAGLLDKETVVMMKQAIMDLKAPELLMYLPNCIGVILMIIAAAVFIVRGINKGKAVSGFLIALAMHMAIALISGLIMNIYIAVVLIFAISLAEFIFALKVRPDLQKPETTSAAEDSFLKSIEEAKSETPSGGEYNPYE